MFTQACKPIVAKPAGEGGGDGGNGEEAEAASADRSRSTTSIPLSTWIESVNKKEVSKAASPDTLTAAQARIACAAIQNKVFSSTCSLADQGSGMEHIRTKGAAEDDPKQAKFELAQHEAGDTLFHLWCRVIASRLPPLGQSRLLAPDR